MKAWYNDGDNDGDNDNDEYITGVVDVGKGWVLVIENGCE